MDHRFDEQIESRIGEFVQLAPFFDSNVKDSFASVERISNQESSDLKESQ